MMRNTTSTIRGVAGAAIGGYLGYLAFVWMVRTQGLYGLVLPGALLGLGCGLCARHVSVVRGVVCGVAAIALGLFSEWHEFPFIDDASFGYFLTHLYKLNHPIPTLGMILLGGGFAAWWGKDVIGGFWWRSKPPARSDDVRPKP